MSKTKTFISVIPYQGKSSKTGEDMLQATIYKPRGNSKLEYGETRFPIVPVINGYAEKGDKVRVIAILTDGNNYTYNYDTYFKPEIEGIVRNKGLAFDRIEPIYTPDREDIDTQLKLFGDIISAVGEDEEVFACITYGTKPTPIVLTMALNYLYRLKKGVSIGCIVYGRYLHDDANNNNGIYDTTALFYMDSLVNGLAEYGASNPEQAIRISLGLDIEDSEDDE